MHVLHHALKIILRGVADVLLHPGVPRFGQIGDRYPLLNQLDLELEAQQDMQVVGHLIRLDTNRRATNSTDRTDHRLGIDSIELAGHKLARHWEVVLPERQRATNHVLVEARLRLVQAQ